MGRQAVCLIAALTINFAVVPAIQANITPVNNPTPLSTMGTISGDIVNIDPVNEMIQVREASHMLQTIHIDEHVLILRRGTTVQLVDLSLGDFVTLREK